MIANSWLKSPRREYAVISLLAAAFALDLLFPVGARVLFVVAAIAAVPTLIAAVRALRTKRRVTIETFNTFALVIAFAAADPRSAGFITLMLTFARLLDAHTRARTKMALEELLKLKPEKATVERGEELVEIEADKVASGEIVVVESGGRVPVDGQVIFGATHVNEASVPGYLSFPAIE